MTSTHREHAGYVEHKEGPHTPPQLNTNQDSTGNKLLKERERERESGRASKRKRERERVREREREFSGAQRLSPDLRLKLRETLPVWTVLRRGLNRVSVPLPCSRVGCPGPSHGPPAAQRVQSARQLSQTPKHPPSAPSVETAPSCPLLEVSVWRSLSPVGALRR